MCVQKIAASSGMWSWRVAALYHEQRKHRKHMFLFSATETLSQFQNR
jgi:hypothetical protein